MNLKSVIIPNTRFLYKKTSDFFNFWNELLADVDNLVKSSNLLDFGSSSFCFHMVSTPGSKGFCEDVWVGREVIGHAVLPKDSYLLDIGKTEAFSANIRRAGDICGVDQFFEESWSKLSSEEKERVSSCRVKVSFFKSGNPLEEWESEVQYLLK